MTRGKQLPLRGGGFAFDFWTRKKYMLEKLLLLLYLCLNNILNVDGQFNCQIDSDSNLKCILFCASSWVKLAGIDPK